ncbi:MAG TPA: fibronectin type III domain-containing protein [Dissulfurispiraceae bacterium]|nr:fibronectin type III domain-containing protein [Dissulfurispiraceae bacterium]
MSSKRISIPGVPKYVRSIGGIFLALIVIVLFTTGNALSAITLTWTAPANNTDGTPLTDLAGYVIYYGTSSGNYTNSANVGKVQSYIFSNLGAGTYYFAATAYNSSGIESQYSNEVAKTASSSQYSLAITRGGTGSGTVMSSPTGISCGTSCSSSYSPGSVITLTAAPNANSVFAGWSGGGCSGKGTCSLTINSNTSITATFTQQSNTYTITASAGTGGSIDPAGTITATKGASQTYSVTPASGYSIASVTVDGASVGAVSSYTFSKITAKHTIVAAFKTDSSHSGRKRSKH